MVRTTSTTAAGLLHHQKEHLIPDDYHDGSHDVHLPVNHYVYFQAYKNNPEYNGDGESDDSDMSCDDMRVGNPKDQKTGLSRIEQRALDKELPVDFIMSQSKDYIQAFVDAARAEEESWKKWDTVSPLTESEAQKILSDAKLRKRVIPSRCAFRDKSKQAGPLRPKCRVVCVGCLDPDLRKLNRDCSTPTRQSEHLLYCLYISGRNKQLLGCQDEWQLWGGDVKTAFLQGKQEGRDEDLYMRPPRDQITRLAGTFKASFVSDKRQCVRSGECTPYLGPGSSQAFGGFWFSSAFIRQPDVLLH